jgi:hypothetical protein
MTGATDLAIGAFIVHIPGDKRREHNVRVLTEVLRAAGVRDVEVFPGVQPPDAGPMFSIGEWGCYQSHTGAIEKAIDHPTWTHVMVLEDDALSVDDPATLGRNLRRFVERDFDFLHLGHTTMTVFRHWDPAITSQDLLRVRGLLLGALCYLVPVGDARRRVEQLREMAHRDARDGGGVGFDGALCNIAWEDPSVVRLAPPQPLFTQLAGIKSQLRATPMAGRARELGAHALKTAYRKLTGRQPASGDTGR